MLNFEQVSAKAVFMSSKDSMISLFLCSIWCRMFSKLRMTVFEPKIDWVCYHMAINDQSSYHHTLVPRSFGLRKLTRSKIMIKFTEYHFNKVVDNRLWGKHEGSSSKPLSTPIQVGASPDRSTGPFERNGYGFEHHQTLSGDHF